MIKDHYQPAEAARVIEELQDKLFYALLRVKMLEKQIKQHGIEVIAYAKCIAELSAIIER